MGKWLNCIFSITSEVMWTIFGSYDHWMIVYPFFYVLWLVAILFGCHGNFKLKKNNFLDDISSKITEAVWLKFCTNVAWVSTIKNS